MCVRRYNVGNIRVWRLSDIEFTLEKGAEIVPLNEGWIFTRIWNEISQISSIREFLEEVKADEGDQLEGLGWEEMLPICRHIMMKL